MTAAVGGKNCCDGTLSLICAAVARLLVRSLVAFAPPVASADPGTGDLIYSQRVAGKKITQLSRK